MVEKKQDTLLLLTLSVALSILLVLAILFNMRLIYQRVYLRILKAANAMNVLASIRSDATLANPIHNDEIGDLEKGLQAFQSNLIALHRSHEELQKLSTHDRMTNLLNHDASLLKLAEIGRQTERYGNPFSVLMIDIDWFKQVNDTHGHLIGDQVLIEIAQVLQRHVRTTDVLGRYGGEEFLLILTQTDQAAAIDTAEKLRLVIAGQTYSERGLAITVSIGVASCTHDCIGTDLLADADAQLYRAKRSGRNQVACLGIFRGNPPRPH